MASYTYDNLDETTEEIRLITLLPSADFDGPIRFVISHVPFAISEPKRHRRVNLPIDDISKTLPGGWDVRETLEGRLIYSYWDGVSEFRTSWSHPSPEFLPPHFVHPPDINFEPKYEALSYTWGSSTNPETASVETTKPLGIGPSTLEIGQNLASALRHLRHADKPRTIWVDALCINQDDIVERSQQVSRMRYIYQHADRVVVWLGPSSNDSALALSTLEYIGKQIELSPNCGRGPAPDCTEPNWFDAGCPLPYSDEVWTAIHNLISRPWFERIWITQEIQVANSKAIIYCGKDETSWYLFRRAILCIFNNTGLPPKVSERILWLEPLCENIVGGALLLF